MYQPKMSLLIGRLLVAMSLLSISAFASQDARPAVPPPDKHVGEQDDTIFQNNFLKATVTSASISKDKKRVTLSLSLQNTSDKDILLSMDATNVFCRTRVIDNQGNAAPVDGFDDVSVTGLTCLWQDSDKKKRENYVTFNPGARTTVVFSFKSQGEFSGDILAFSAELLRLEDISWSRFSVGVSQIKTSH